MATRANILNPSVITPNVDAAHASFDLYEFKRSKDENDNNLGCKLAPDFEGMDSFTFRGCD